MMIEPITVGLIGLGCLAILVVIGMQVAYAGALVGLMGIVVTIGARRVRDTGDFWDILDKGWEPGLKNAGTIPFSELAHYSLSVLPMFILIGYMAFHARLTQGAFYCMRMWFGHLPGGLAISTILTCAGFSATSGSSVATAATVGAISLPEMKQAGYDKRLSAGCVAAGGVLGVLIPPSVLLVFYAALTEVSAGKMLVAGILPGILSVAVFVAGVFIISVMKPDMCPKGERVGWKKRITSLRKAWQLLVLIIVVLGSIYTGWATPTEAASLGAVASVLFLLCSNYVLF